MTESFFVHGSGANSTEAQRGIPCLGDVSNITSTQFTLVICVKYGSDEETEKYLDSMRTLQSQERLHVLVVDNTVKGTWVGDSSKPNCRAVQAPDNLGYFGGARYGLSLYLETNPLPDWVIVSNVDLSIEDPLFLDRLTRLGSIPNLGAVAPSIRSSLTGIDQNPYMRVRPTALRMHFYKWLFRSWVALNTYECLSVLYKKISGQFRKDRSGYFQSGPSEEIYAPHGSFLIFSRTYFERGGDLQFPRFLFGEEIYIAESMRRLGLKVLYEPSLQVIHKEHHSTGLFRSRRIAAYVASSAAYCADTFFGFDHQEKRSTTNVIS